MDFLCKKKKTEKKSENELEMVWQSRMFSIVSIECHIFVQFTYANDIAFFSLSLLL